MPLRLILSLILTVIYFLPDEACSQQRTMIYKLVKGTDTVGELKVEEYWAGSSRTIKSNAIVKIPAVLFDITIEDVKNVEFREGILQTASVSRKIFDGKPELCKTVWSDNAYTDGYRPLPFMYGVREIIFSASMLHRHEPGERKRVYSEFHRQFISVMRLSVDSYCIRYPDGQTCYYYYEKGICIRIITKTTWATIESVLINKNLALK